MCSLDFKNIYELTVATILSAQCTDKRVNIVTPDLFKKYPDFESLFKSDLTDLMKVIKSTGFYRNKAKNLKALGTLIMQEHNGVLPDNLESLILLPGIGRKTANCVMGNGFGIASGVVVDTHVKRLSYRIGLSDNKDPEKVEKDLIKIIPKKKWIIFSHYLILHGRAVCKARKPECDKCRLYDHCLRRLT